MPFKFHETIDSETITSYYGDDYSWIEETFATVLGGFGSDLAAIEQNLSKGDVEELRKAVHKMKPAFGYVGMLGMQEMCRKLEERCQASVSIDEVRNDAISLLNQMTASRKILEAELERLKTYNKTAQ